MLTDMKISLFLLKVHYIHLIFDYVKTDSLKNVKNSQSRASSQDNQTTYSQNFDIYYLFQPLSSTKRDRRARKYPLKCGNGVNK